MESLKNFIMDSKDVLLIQFSSFGFMDLIDLLVVAYLFYKIIGFVRETRAAQLIKGVLLLLILLQLSDWLSMNTLNFVLVNTMQLGLIAILIIFQPELRRALEQVGRSRIGSKLFLQDDEHSKKMLEDAIDAVCSACEYLNRNKIGALMVFERHTKLGDITSTGIVLDADLTGELLVSVFFPNNPIHDGAVIIKNGRLHAAGCFLPLTQKSDLSKSLGTRHRAAIGITETSDAYVIVVSEESGLISTADKGELQRGYKLEELRAELRTVLAFDEGEKKEKFFSRLRKKLRGGKGGASK